MAILSKFTQREWSQVFGFRDLRSIVAEESFRPEIVRIRKQIGLHVQGKPIDQNVRVFRQKVAAEFRISIGCVAESERTNCSDTQQFQYRRFEVW